MDQTGCWPFIGLLSQRRGALREMRCSSFGLPLNFSRCHSRCVWFTDHSAPACAPVRPSVPPVGASASIPIRPCSSSPSFRRAAAAWIRRGASFGGILPIFQTREPVLGAERGGGRVCPPPRSSERLRPSPTGAISREPSVPPSATGGFSVRVFR